MAQFDIEIGGKPFTVEAPDMETVRQRMPSIMAGLGVKPLDLAPGTSAISPGEDVPRLVTSALGRGSVGLAGLPGEAERLAQLGFDWGERVVGARDKPQTEEELRAKRLFADTGEMVNRYETMTDTPFYQPKTRTGRFIDTGLSMVPGTLLGGPKGPISNAMRYGVIPGVVSEAAGQVAEKFIPSLEEPVRVMAGLAAGGRAAMKDRPIPIGKTADVLRSEGAKFFEEARQRGVVLKPDSFNKFVDDLGSTLYREKIAKGIDTNSYRVLSELENMKGAAVDLEELKKIRSIASEGSVNLNNATDARLSGMTRRKIDDYVSGLSGSDVLAGDVKGVPELLNNGRQLWTQMYKAEEIEGAFKRASNSNAWSKGNKDEAIRVEFRKIANRDDFERSYTVAERKAIQDVIDANTPEKIARVLGGASPERGLRNVLAGAGAGAAAGYALGGPTGAAIGAGAVVPASLGAASIGNRMTLSQANLVKALIGGYTPEGVLSKGVRNSRNAVLGAYLLNMTANRPGHKAEAR